MEDGECIGGSPTTGIFLALGTMSFSIDFGMAQPVLVKEKGNKEGRMSALIIQLSDGGKAQEVGEKMVEEADGDEGVRAKAEGAVEITESGDLCPQNNN